MPLRHGMLREYAGILELGIRLIDVAFVAGTGWLTMWMHQGAPGTSHLFQVIAIMLVTLTSVIIFPIFGIYRSWRGQSLLSFGSRLGVAWLSVFAFLVSMLFLADITESVPRSWLAHWGVVGLTALVLGRTLLFSLLRFLRKLGLNQRRVLIIGAGDLGVELSRRIDQEDWSGYEVIGFLDDDPSKRRQPLARAPVLGPIDIVAEQVKALDVDEVWIALPLRAEERVREAIALLRHCTVNIRFVPDIFGFRLLNHAVSEVVGFPMLDLSSTPMTGTNRLIKAVEDRLLALILLLVFSPLMVAIAVGVRLSGPGPVIFKQARHGWDGREIKVYKFRTMIPHTEQDGKITQARPNDPRLTRFGTFLRRTSLDELPQLYNVLQGRMSIVGPRPHALSHNEFYKDRIDCYMLRHKVKPGITGWAQVNGYRGETDTLEKMQKRVEYDLYYIEHWSLWFDLKIIALTVLRGFIHKNAY